MIKTDIEVNNLHGEIERQASPIIRSFTLGIEGEMKRLMALPKHGREYKRRKRVHIASAKGEAPAVDTGNLINSIQTTFPDKVTGRIGIGAEYAVWLEFFMERPFVRPAIDGTIRQFREAGIIRSVRRSFE